MADEVSGAEPQLHRASKLALWLFVVAVAALAIQQTKPPRALGPNAPADQFSAARAMVHVEQIAGEPHPIGTAANRRVRDYLVQQLEALGAEVQLHRTVGVTNSGRVIYAGTAENIIGRIKGTNGGPAVMLATHYDSVPPAPGAADAGAGIASILEVIRALKARGPLKSDVLVLFTDGEEEGLLGASGFVNDHPDVVRQIGVVMNFEARGSSGPVMMFETSDGNGWLTREFARAAPHPMASSLAYAVYKELPNDTDMTVFKRAGLAGLNFAFSASFENYHTPRDTPENLDLRSLQHMGANALALTRHFGDAPVAPIRQADRVYFNWFGDRLIHYQAWVVWAVFAAAIALLITVLIVAGRRRLITVARTAAGFGSLVLLLLASLAGAHLTWWLIHFVAGDRLLVGDTWSNTLLVLGCVMMAAAFCIALQAWLVKKFGGYNVASGQLIAFTLVTAAVTFASPAASYVFEWPLVFALAGMLVGICVDRPGIRVISGVIGATPAILIFAPLTYLLFVLLGLAGISVSVVALLFALALAAISPLFVQICRSPRLPAALMLVASLGLVIAGLGLSRFSREHPRRNSIVYSVNADDQKAAWISYDETADVWTQQFLGEDPRRTKIPKFTLGVERPMFSAEAPLLPLERPTATVLSDRIEAGERLLKLHLASRRQANVLLMRLPSEVTIRSLLVNGRFHAIETADAQNSSWFFRYTAPPPEGVEVELRLASPAPFICWVGDRSLGIPEIPGRSYPPRTPEFMADDGSDLTLVGRQYTF